MRQKGFTLIELLAVIVILAIIALIATPIILGIIKDSKIESNKRSAENYFDAVELAVANKNTKGKFNPKECTISDQTKELICEGNFDKVHCGGEIACTTANLEVKVDGSNPTNVTLKFQNGLVIDGTTITIGGSSLIKKNNKIELEKEIIVGNFNSVCEKAEDSTVQGYEAGAKYSCKVDPDKDRYTFYVLKTPEKGSKTIDLIMDQNINSDGTLAGMNMVSKESNSNQYNVVSWNDEQNQATNEYGPVTVIKFLNEATKDWTNIKPLNYEYKDKEFIDSTIYGYDSLIINNGVVYINDTKLNLTNLMYSRILIYSNDDKKTEISRKNSLNTFLYNNLDIPKTWGYWTFSSSIENSFSAYSVHAAGEIYSNYVYSDSIFGVRPVITLDI